MKGSAIDLLCRQCGFCCNGILFGDVELQPQDSAPKLQSLGLVLKKKRSKTAFCQPCSQLQGGLCAAYISRPSACRAFECRLLQKVAGGKLAPDVASAKIKAARQQVERIEKLLHVLGDTRPDLPLNKRCSLVIRQPEDLSAGARTRQARSRLMKEFHRLSVLLERDFVGDAE